MTDPAHQHPTLPAFALWASRWRATAMLVLAVLLGRLLYAWFMGVYTLVEDEAHYWEWSRRLDWSYYSKGPGIAWLIRLATEALGTSEAAIRTPAAVAHALGALCIAGLARMVSGDGRAGFFAAALFSLIPVFQAVALVMTIDGPYVACWAWASLAGLIAMQRQGRWAWLSLGLAVAVGFLFKYTMLLLVPGLLIFALLGRGRLNMTPRWGRWALAGLVVAMLGCLPVGVWNAQNDWSTVRHLMGHAGMEGGDQAIDASQPRIRWDMIWTLEMIGVQLAAVGPVMALLIGGVIERVRTNRDGAIAEAGSAFRVGRMYCVCIAAPVLLFYLVFSLFSRIEGNWPMAGYITLVALAGGHLVRRIDQLAAHTRRWSELAPDQRGRAGLLRRSPESLGQIAWHWTLGYGLLAGLLMLRLDLLAGLPWPGERAPLERVAARLMDADTRAADAARLLESAAAESGREPFLISQQYGYASQMAFYLPGRPKTYAASSLLGGRRTQYDAWAQTDLRSPSVVAELAGRPAVLLGAYQEQWVPVFVSLVPLGPLKGESKSGRDAYLGYGFRGFPGYETESASPSEPVSPIE